MGKQYFEKVPFLWKDQAKRKCERKQVQQSQLAPKTPQKGSANSTSPKKSHPHRATEARQNRHSKSRIDKEQVQIKLPENDRSTKEETDDFVNLRKRSRRQNEAEPKSHEDEQ